MTQRDVSGTPMQDAKARRPQHGWGLQVPPHESTRGAPEPPAARSSDPGMEPSEDPSLSTPLVGIWAPRLSGRTRPRCFGGPFVFTSTNLSPQASSLNVEEFQDLWPCLSLVTEQGPTGDKQSPEGDEAQLWSTCLCLESLASFVLMRPGEYWAILQQYGLLPSHGSCLWNSGEAGPGTGAGTVVPDCWRLARPLRSGCWGCSVTGLTF